METITQSKPKVLCAMSGGVDSSVATSLLKEQGYEVIGSMMRFWPDDRPAGAFDLCCSPEAAYDARRIADKIDIPFYLLDYRDKFDQIVVDPFIPSYEGGKTPNPCVWCNREIKFGSFVKRAQLLGCEFMATGHYVRRVEGKDGIELHRGDDDGKDQTYFLWALPKEILKYILFPLGELSKAEVRKLAAERDFSVADKKSSSGLCFITTSVRDYLTEFSEENPGPIYDAADDYKQIGTHKGIQFYTIGQRKGLGLYHSHLIRFVLDLRPEDNSVIVGMREQCQWQALSAVKANFLTNIDKLPKRVMAQTRYRQNPIPATLELTSEESFKLVFDEPVFAITLGQSTVLYEGDRLLGGGVIETRS
ncbi:MAG: tRNA 2-thiouridine(34) synthase MnmA [Trueperaceae bacterium]|nr:tRNA 2-thiouridine(34) synthase MnmA [Trueperaceae bacterium]